MAEQSSESSAGKTKNAGITGLELGAS